MPEPSVAPPSTAPSCGAECSGQRSRGRPCAGAGGALACGGEAVGHCARAECAELVAHLFSVDGCCDVTPAPLSPRNIALPHQLGVGLFLHALGAEMRSIPDLVRRFVANVQAARALRRARGRPDIAATPIDFGPSTAGLSPASTADSATQALALLAAWEEEDRIRLTGRQQPIARGTLPRG